MAKTDQSLWTLTIGFGFIVAVGLLFSDVLIPSFAQWADYWRLYYPCAQALTHAGSFAGVLKILAGVPPAATPASAFLSSFVPPSETFLDMPLTLWVLSPFSLLPQGFSQAAWHMCSLLGLAYGAFAVGRAAVLLELDADDTHDVGWACISFMPMLVTLLEGQLGLVFGLLPLAIGYWLLTKKRPAQAGLIWSLLLLKPAFLIVALTNAIAQGLAKKFNCLIGLICGLAVLSLIAALSCGSAFSIWLSQLYQFGVQPQSDPRLDVGMSHAFMTLLPAENQNAGVESLTLFIALVISLVGFVQLKQLAESPTKRDQLAPFATLLGTSMVPIVAPHLPFYDLSVLCMGALVIYTMEWREHLEWRVHSAARMQWLCVNAYFLLFLIKKDFALPIVIVVLLIAFYMRTVETIRFAASAPDV